MSTLSSYDIQLRILQTAHVQDGFIDIFPSSLYETNRDIVASQETFSGFDRINKCVLGIL